MSIPENTYKTGRSRTITGSGEFTISAFAVSLTLPTPGRCAYYTGECKAAIECGPFSLYASLYVTVPNPDGSGTFISNGPGMGEIFAGPSGPAPFSLSVSQTYTFEFSFEVEEYFVISSNTYYTTLGGPDQTDGPVPRICQFVEFPKIGGDFSCTVWMNGNQIRNESYAFDEFSPFAYQDMVKRYKSATTSDLWYGNTSGGIGVPPDPTPPRPADQVVAPAMRLTLMGVPLHRPDIVFENSGGGLEAFADYSDPENLVCGIRALAGTAETAGNARTGEPFGFFSDFTALSLPTKYTYLGSNLINLAGVDFPADGISIKLSAASHVMSELPAGSTSTKFEAVYRENGVNLLHNTYQDYEWHLGPWNPIFVYLDADSLTRQGEDPRDWRLCFRGFRWDALEVSKASSLTIDDCTSMDNWTAGPNTTISELITALQFTSSSGGAGSATLTIPYSVQCWEGYRYLRITGYASNPCTIAVTLAGQTWLLPLTTSSQSIDLDLCCAYDDGTDVSPKSSRYPLSGYGFSPYNPASGFPQDQYALGWGVDYAAGLTVGSIPISQSVTLSQIELVCVGGESALTLLEPFLGAVQGWSMSPGVNLQPYAFIQTDGRISDWPGMIQPSGSRYSISSLRDMLAHVPGTTATLLPDPDDGYHSSIREALLVGGMGSTYDWSTKAWKDWVDVPLSSTSFTIPAQDLFDGVVGYPGVGNPFDGSDYPGPGEDDALPLVTRKILRGQGAGIAYDEDGLPDEGLDVSAESADGVLAGVGRVGADGTYRTGDPFGSGNKNVTTFIDGVNPDPRYSSTQMWQNRRRVRTSFRAQPLLLALASPPYVGQASAPCGGKGAHASNPLPDQQYAWSLPDVGPA